MILCWTYWTTLQITLSTHRHPRPKSHALSQVYKLPIISPRILEVKYSCSKLHPLRVDTLCLFQSRLDHKMFKQNSAQAISTSKIQVANWPTSKSQSIFLFSQLENNSIATSRHFQILLAHRAAVSSFTRSLKFISMQWDSLMSSTQPFQDKTLGKPSLGSGLPLALIKLVPMAMSWSNRRLKTWCFVLRSTKIEFTAMRLRGRRPLLCLQRDASSSVTKLTCIFSRRCCTQPPKVRGESVFTTRAFPSLTLDICPMIIWIRRP